MDKIFKCDCGTHVIQFEYTGADKDFDFEDFSIMIYDVYNPDTGRRYKNPKCLGDVVLLNNRYPKELDDFFDFMKTVLKSRKKAVHEYRYREVNEDDIDKAIERVQELDQIALEKRKQEEKDKNEKNL